MGTDIHALVEIRTHAGWAAMTVVDGEAVQLDIPRNTEAFALLGHAKSTAVLSVDPIVAARGVPADISDEVAAVIESYQGDGVDDSWLTLGDLYTHDWAIPATEFSLYGAWGSMCPELVNLARAAYLRGLTPDQIRIVYTFA